jgi:hypothetical protein
LHDKSLYQLKGSEPFLLVHILVTASVVKSA